MPHLLADTQLDLAAIAHLQQAPAPYTPSTAPFWDDPHISASMLAAHLDPHTAAASRPPETIDRSVAWLIASLGLRPGDAVLDLGCGPGLYSQRLAAHGLRVTGIDYSQRSISYAIEQAKLQGHAIDYRYQDYLTLNEQQAYDAALLIYGDFCVLSPSQRSTLLQRIHAALRPGGFFVLDVSTRLHRQRHGARTNWYVAEQGFWRPTWHLVLTQGFDYPDQSLYLDQYIVIDADGSYQVYRNWFQDYDAAQIQAELAEHGFHVVSMWDDLTGTPQSDNSEWIGVVAQKSDKVTR